MTSVFEGHGAAGELLKAYYALKEQGPLRKPARSLPPVPTLGELNREPHWLWVDCARWQCGHKAPIALAPLIIRWGGRHLLRHATTLGAVHALRPTMARIADAELGRRKERIRIAALPEVWRAKRRLGGNQTAK